MTAVPYVQKNHIWRGGGPGCPIIYESQEYGVSWISSGEANVPGRIKYCEFSRDHDIFCRLGTVVIASVLFRINFVWNMHETDNS